jgi:hypothetical protein
MGVAAWLAALPAMAAPQPAPPAAAAQPSADEAEFERLATLFEQRRAAGDAAGAAALAERLAALGEQLLGAADPDYVSMIDEVLGYLVEQERRAELLPTAERAHRALTAAVGPDDPSKVAALMVLSNAIYSSGDFARADPLMPVALAQAEKAFGADEEAAPLAERAFPVRERVFGPSHPPTLRALSVLATAYLATDRPDKAEPLFARAMADSEKRLGNEHPDFLVAAENVVAARLLANVDDPRALEPARRLLAGARARRARRSPGWRCAATPSGKAASWPVSSPSASS